MSEAHDHGKGSNERAMWLALALTGGFMVVEVIGGVLTGSLALLSDAAHMLTDTTALVIALFAIRIGRRAADARRTYGYARFEILAAAFNAAMLFVVAFYILYEAYARLSEPQQIQSSAMLVVAVVGMIVNFISMRLLTGGKDESLNVKGAYLEVWSDLLGSLGVIVGALVIRFTGWLWVDTVIAVAIALWVLPRTWTLLKASVNVLLEGVPDGVNLDDIRSALRSTPGVQEAHDLHVWAITSGKTSLSAHLLLNVGADAEAVRLAVGAKLREQFGIRHSTLQCELTPCDSPDDFGLLPLPIPAGDQAGTGHRNDPAGGDLRR
ncbi:cation transporter [Stagnimonas aquatica]|uniref:Cation transporter n=1 Tax=Stagnimonas aquatica TaxID=2689987 RepID=A0A3N0VA85_9GAMM|nr:cation diffusion facilitator family transporter [Stagnimonas aquatica]ROH89703.1 cation transporter [Stagnimonas aquatica]